MPWNRKGQSTPVFLPGKFYGRRGPVAYIPWVSQRVGYILECVHAHTHTHTHTHIIDNAVIYAVKTLVSYFP